MMTVNGNAIYAHLREFPFKMYEAVRHFTSFGNLSSALLDLHDIRDSEDYSLVVRLERLVDFDPEILSKPEQQPVNLKESIANLIQMLKHCRKKDLGEHLKKLKDCVTDKKLSKKVVVVNLIKQILIPLFGTVEVENGYRVFLDKLGGVEGCTLALLGVGSEQTWHGASEVRVRDCNIMHVDSPMLEDIEVISDTDDDDDTASTSGAKAIGTSDSCPSPGSSVVFEGKLQMNIRKHVSQLSVSCVVNSFIENNLHPNLNPMVPSILFNKTAFRIGFYNCVEDVLLISEPRALTTNNGISKTAVLLLWLVVNHR